MTRIWWIDKQGSITRDHYFVRFLRRKLSKRIWTWRALSNKTAAMPMTQLVIWQTTTGMESPTWGFGKNSCCTDCRNEALRLRLRELHSPAQLAENPCTQITCLYFSVIVFWFNGHFRNLNWRYLPYIRPKFQGISPQFIWSKIWYVYVPPSIGSWRSRANPRHLVLSVLQEKGVAHRWPHLWGHKLGMHTATRTLPTSEKSLKSPEIHT